MHPFASKLHVPGGSLRGPDQLSTLFTTHASILTPGIILSSATVIDQSPLMCHDAPQYAAALGGVVDALDISPDKEKEARSLGASGFVVFTDEAQVSM